MLRMHASTDDYLEIQVRTASPEKLHLMVIEGALRYGKQGLEALNQGNFERSFETLSRCRDCVAELLSGIKAEPDAELAEKLRAVFVFVHKQLAAGDLNHDPRPIQDALTVLEVHRDTWRELIQRLQTERAPASSTNIPSPSASWVT
jgi:flagellar protein FliS